MQWYSPIIVRLTCSSSRNQFSRQSHSCNVAVKYNDIFSVR